MDFLEIIDELHREYFPAAQTSLLDRDSSDGEEYSSDSESDDMNKNDIHDRCQLYACQTNTTESKPEDVSMSDLGQIVREKVNDGCHCQMKCISNLSFEEILGHICCMKELSNEERDMYLMGKLKCSGTWDDSGKQIKRQRYHYNFDDREICKDAFLFIHAIGEKYLKNLVRHMKTNGIRPRIHGNTGKTPHNALKYDDTQYVVSFIQRYAEEHGLPMPAAPRGRDTDPPIFLPCSLTKKDLHASYSEACSTSDIRCVKLSSFYAIWSTCLPSIQIATPRTDVCSTCDNHRVKIMYAHTENEKLDATRLFTEHLNKVEREHKHYIKCIEEARIEHRNLFLENAPRVACSTEYVKSHYTFDFAQNVTVPHHSRQVGPLFFETPRKIQIFGICMEGSSTQYNYLLDEDQTIGKDGKSTHGPNTVLSILHHHFQEFGFGEKSAVLHCDNCGGLFPYT
ncbi:uncharacterized protein LOC134249479 isoform X1 [Saccostrea cucullata]|uniref:uncharacterized protein LOC134249479 isoform X1 n=2 Tax=Saccostrea cuccullata TaxID=36930 RepID=UPI002ED52463